MRVSQPRLARAMARQVRSCLSELPNAPSMVRNELLSIASTLRYLSAELEYGADCAKACDLAAERLRAQLGEQGLDLGADVPRILEAIASPAFAGARADVIFTRVVEYLHACNQAELEVYRRGLQASGKNT